MFCQVRFECVSLSIILYVYQFLECGYLEISVFLSFPVLNFSDWRKIENTTTSGFDARSFSSLVTICTRYYVKQLYFLVVTLRH